MSDLYVCPIVEGHGEYEAVRPLVQRIWTELLGGNHVEVLRPIRHSRGKLLIAEELQRAIGLACGKLNDVADGEAPKLVLVLLDAEDDRACALGPRLLTIATEACRRDMRVTCVVANVMYETWFVAAAESLGEFIDLQKAGAIPEDPETRRSGKGWLKQLFKRAKYSETVDQPAMTMRMDLALCRRRSPSFDKLCRELARERVVPANLPAGH